MPASEYESKHEGEWFLLVQAEKWTRGLWGAVLECLENHAPEKHPQTVSIVDPATPGRKYYLKMYDCVTPGAAIKDVFRDSKAFRALKISAALLRQGFEAPVPLAAGERRRWGVSKQAFLLTTGIEGDSLPVFLWKRFSAPASVYTVKVKRKHVEQLAAELRRFHQLRFVHGDLVPTNIFVRSDRGDLAIVYMDNDRTRRYPRWIPQNLWKRNLVQLNRFCLAGISLQDRMRFMHGYFEKKRWSKKDAAFLRWLERKTRRRREECDQIDAPVSFRELMRWNGPFAGRAG